MRKYVAEFIATFFLVFAGVGAILSDAFLASESFEKVFGLLGVALAHGIALSVAIAAVIRISGGHVNPAVTIAFWVARRLSLQDMLGYLGGQFLGGISAAFLLKLLTPAEIFDFNTGVPALNGVEVVQGAGIEVILTFFLVFVIWGVAVDEKGPRALAPWAIGLTVTFDILAGGAFTGAAMNPARWLGPALAGGGFANAVVWTAGPILGGLLASLLYETVFLADEMPPGTAPKRGELPTDDLDDDLDLDDDDDDDDDLPPPPPPEKVETAAPPPPSSGPGASPAPSERASEDRPTSEPRGESPPPPWRSGDDRTEESPGTSDDPSRSSGGDAGRTGQDRGGQTGSGGEPGQDRGDPGDSSRDEGSSPSP